MNHIGKALVLINLVLSIVLMTWALVLIVQPVDYGWKEPRKVWVTSPPEGKKEPNELIASRIDERVAGYVKLQEARGDAVAWARQVAKNLAQKQGGFGYNHREYVREAKRLWEAPGTIAIAEIRKADGTFTKPKYIPGQLWDMPIWDQPVPGVDKSYTQYLVDLWKKAREIEEVSKRIGIVHDQQEKLTVQLNGVRGKDGKVVEPGYYDLRETEAEAQKKLREEIEYQKPRWVMELFNAQYLRERRLGLEKRLLELGEDPSSVLLK
jgi:hypothetical protein